MRVACCSNKKSPCGDEQDGGRRVPLIFQFVLPELAPCRLGCVVAAVAGLSRLRRAGPSASLDKSSCTLFGVVADRCSRCYVIGGGDYNRAAGFVKFGMRGLGFNHLQEMGQMSMDLPARA